MSFDTDFFFFFFFFAISGTQPEMSEEKVLFYYNYKSFCAHDSIFLLTLKAPITIAADDIIKILVFYFSFHYESATESNQFT